MATRRRRDPTLTTPDLVVVSLLLEKPLHGYALVAELERREVSDWAGISRPQVYYSLDKLEKAGLIRAVSDFELAGGPERRVFKATAAAKARLADALDQQHWARQRPPPPFTTWAVLSLHARRATITRMIDERRGFLEEQLAKERATLSAIRADSGPMVEIAAAVVELCIKQFELELDWLGRHRHAFGPAR